MRLLLQSQRGTLAQITTPPLASVGEVLSKVVSVLYGLGLMLFVVFVVWSGILWITSEGDPGKVQKAQKTLVAAVIGLVIMLFAFAIRSVLEQIIK